MDAALETDPIYRETASTLPVDVHAFRRAGSSEVARAGVNLQHGEVTPEQ